jgi:ubiquitin-conjugating enzyme (huntingtin interacting protein 2)
MDARLRRVNKEIAGRTVSSLCYIYSTHAPFKDCKNDKTSSIQIELIDDSPFHLKGTFPGPEETPYEGGRFDVVSD